MVMLTSFIGVLAILCSWKEIVQRIGFFHLNLLWILGGVLGVFMAVDLFLFFFFWEMMLVPMYFLIALWGHSVTDGKSPDQRGHQVLHLHPGERPHHAGGHPGPGADPITPAQVSSPSTTSTCSTLR